MHVSRWACLLVVAGCARVAVRDGVPTTHACPRLGALTQQIDQLGSATVQQACDSGDRCDDGPYACRCEGPHGGAPRPAWWLCHRAMGKPDGCPDDAVLLARGACSSEGQQCRVPLSCGCSDFQQATCTQGHWSMAECRSMCLAP